jgi:hypothetical protein
MSDVPDVNQCTMPSCEAPKADYSDEAGLCADHLKALSDSGGTDTDEPESADPHTPLDSDTVHEHYDRAKPAYEALSTVSEYPTLGLDDKNGWYITRDCIDIDPLEEGYTKRRRPASMARDLRTVLGRIDRTFYGLTTFKTPDAVSRWKYGSIEDGEFVYAGNNNATPDPKDLRAVTAWGDIDLNDELKLQRGDLDEATRATAEATLEAYIQEFATLVGGRDAVYALDSVGGAYIFTAPAVSVPIYEHVAAEHDDDLAAAALQEVIERSNSYLSDAQERVEERVNGAADVIDPDWANNHNRKYKAPLSIHGDHAAVVTPLDVDDVDYRMTPLDAVDDDLIAEAREWAAEFTALEHTDRAEDLVATLWADEYAEHGDWRAALDAWVAEREAERDAKQWRDGLRTDDEADRDRDLDLEDLDITPYVSDVEQAIDRLDIYRVADDTIVHRWTEDLSDATDRSGSGKKAIVPTWANGYNSGNATYVDESKGTFVDTANGDHGTAVEMALIDAENWSVGDIARGRDWARGVHHLQDLGYDIPVWTPDAETAPDANSMPYWSLRRAARALGVVDEDDLIKREGENGGTYLGFPDAATYNAALKDVEEAGFSTGRSPVGDSRDGGAAATQFPVAECAPPERRPVDIDVDEVRADLRTDLFDDVLEDDALHLWSHDPGTGKTTSSALGNFDNDQPHVFYFPNHEKARDHITDEVVPGEDYFHLKGAEQPVHDCCMDASVDAGHIETPECAVHGHPGEWPRMCPVYELDADHPVRRRFEELVPEVGVQKAHRILNLTDTDEHLWHPEECCWEAEYSGLDSHDHIAAVHPYVTQKTVRDGRLNIVDEAATLNREERSFSVEQLTRLANSLNRLADTRKVSARDDPVVFTLNRLAQFARDIIDLITDGAGDNSLDAIKPPTPVWNAYESFDDAAGNYVEREEPDEPWQHAEALAKAKVALAEHIIRRMKDDTWEGTPLSMDPLLAAAAAADDDHDRRGAVMKAIAVPALLDTCPWCSSSLEPVNGAWACSSDSCDWDERSHTLTQKDGERARALSWITTNSDDCPQGLAYRAKPLPSELPDPAQTLALDATGDREAVAARFDVDPADIHVAGDEPLALPNARVLQVVDGQYHKTTIKESEHARTRIQNVIETAGDVYRRPLFVMEKQLLDANLFEFPDHAVVRHYHALRGLNLEDCDAVIPVGAPHPDVEDLEHEARLLAMGREDLRIGGAEHSTRRDETGSLAANPPVYRKLNYTDDNGRGRAIPTKHYTGLVGSLFRERREHELLQTAHRVRPLLASSDDPVDIIMLTNVPTSLELDDVVTFDELADPLTAMFPVPDGALELLEAVDDVIAGDGPDGFRSAALIEQRDDRSVANKVEGFHRLAQLAGVTPQGSDGPPSRRTVRNWVQNLEEVGLLVPEEYEQHAGVSYSVDFATLQDTLSILSDNGGFKVAAVRRFRSLVTASDGSLRWLRWARDAFDLSGDRCEWDPPPHDAT